MLLCLLPVHQILRISVRSALITKPQYFWTKRAYNTFGRVCIFTDAYILAQVLITDEWAGKVKAVVKEVKMLDAKVDAKMDALNAKVDAQALQGAKLGAKMDAMLAALQLLSQSKFDDEPEPSPSPSPSPRAPPRRERDGTAMSSSNRCEPRTLLCMTLSTGIVILIKPHEFL